MRKILSFKDKKEDFQPFYLDDSRDTFISKGTATAALLSSGGLTELVDQGKVTRLP